jgi:prolipoprotein diacylglyceryl transferase
MLPLSIPSPSQGVWHVGAFPVRAYAIAILVGIVAAAWIATRRFRTRTAGGTADDVLGITFWAVPFGIVGGRIYHVITTPQPYFGEHGRPLHALFIWEGGLGIWGAIALGALGAWIGCRRYNIRFPVFADAVAPGLLVAQAIGRLGNWFNQELFGSPTTKPWGLEISPGVIDNLNRATGSSFPADTLFHPTFLYELLWNLAAAVFIVWLDRRFRLGHGRVFWAYVATYTLGRVWIEALRVDTAEHILGLRLNVWVSIIVFLGAVVAFVLIGRRRPGREDDARRVVPAPDDADASAAETALDDAHVSADDPVTETKHS